MNTKWGELANKLGTVAEDIVAPNIPRIATDVFGIGEIDDFSVLRRKRNALDSGRRREFEAIAVSKTHFVLNETKATPKIEYIDKFIETLDEIWDWFPEYREKTLLPIFSSLYIPEEIVKYLTRKSIFAMAMVGDTMEIINIDEVPMDTA